MLGKIAKRYTDNEIAEGVHLVREELPAL